MRPQDILPRSLGFQGTVSKFQDHFSVQIKQDLLQNLTCELNNSFCGSQTIFRYERFPEILQDIQHMLATEPDPEWSVWPAWKDRPGVSLRDVCGPVVVAVVVVVAPRAAASPLASVETNSRRLIMSRRKILDTLQKVLVPSSMPRSARGPGVWEHSPAGTLGRIERLGWLT